MVAAFGTFDGSGFRFEFGEREGKIDRQPFERLKQDAIEIRGASVDAVVETTDAIKQRIRTYINAHFTGSAFTSNNNRRVANAAAQSKFYDDLDSKGQYAGLVYSKFGIGGPGGFVDFLLLHVRGGTIKPRTGNWLRIPNAEAFGSHRRQTGFFPLSGRDVFFVRSGDGRKLFLLRNLRRARGGDRKTELLATLVRTLTFRARLSGIDEIARTRGDLLEQNFRAALTARGVGEAGGG